MRRKLGQPRFILLGLVIVILLGSLWLQAMHIGRMYHNINWPNAHSRQLTDRRIHRWMNAEEVARDCHVDVAQVFRALDIQPQPGDEKLPLRDLGSKYNKSTRDIQQGLEMLSEQTGNPGSQNHE